MSQVVRTSISCPRCGQAFQAIIEQIIDVGRDPQAKARFLSGRVNMVTCPNCGHTLAVGTPLLYHDPNKKLLLIYVPMELNITTEERERIIGDMTRRLTDSLPPENRKGYLLQPQQALTIPGMIDTILDADGITEDIREAQREKMQVMEMFLQVSPEQWPVMIEEHDWRCITT
jgi:ribosomal protein S27AE